MAQVTLAIGGRRYELACRDGEEAHLKHLATLVDAKAIDAGRALGTTNEARQLLLASLLLADQVEEARKAATGSGDALEGLDEALDTLAARLERLAARLEGGAATS